MYKVFDLIIINKWNNPHGDKELHCRAKWSGNGMLQETLVTENEISKRSDSMVKPYPGCFYKESKKFLLMW